MIQDAFVSHFTEYQFIYNKLVTEVAQTKKEVKLREQTPSRKKFPFFHVCTGFEPLGVCTNFRSIFSGQIFSQIKLGGISSTHLKYHVTFVANSTLSFAENSEMYY
jgi:hypothetical protein